MIVRGFFSEPFSGTFEDRAGGAVGVIVRGFSGTRAGGAVGVITGGVLVETFVFSGIISSSTVLIRTIVSGSNVKIPFGPTRFTRIIAEYRYPKVYPAPLKQLLILVIALHVPRCVIALNPTDMKYMEIGNTM